MQYGHANIMVQYMEVCQDRTCEVQTLDIVCGCQVENFSYEQPRVRIQISTFVNMLESLLDS